VDQLDRSSPNNCLSHKVFRELASLQGGAADRAGAVGLGPAALAVQTDQLGRQCLTAKTIANEMLISCKRPVITYGPLSLLGAGDAGGTTRSPRLSAALAG
jgi:hypothetical protein